MFPQTSGPVPVKSKIAVPSDTSMETKNTIFKKINSIIHYCMSSIFPHVLIYFCLTLQTNDRTIVHEIFSAQQTFSSPEIEKKSNRRGHIRYSTG